MTSLYLCYQSLLEPLTQTQVVAYLEGLVQAGNRIILLTFEPRSLTPVEITSWQKRLSDKGILWYWLRYHKRPTVPATAWDILSGVVVGWRLTRLYQVNLLHARAHVPGMMALVLKWLTGAKFLFDIRGFMAEEYADAGIWSKDGMLFRLTKRTERMLVKAADGIVVLTEKAKTLLQHWYPSEVFGKSIRVIPCCVDLRQFPAERIEKEGVAGERKGTTLVYTGKLGGWYPVREMVEFVSTARRYISDLQWQVWTQSDPALLRQEVTACGLENVVIGRATPQDLSAELQNAEVGLSLYKRNLSAPGCSPTKIGEYLAAGLPVVSTAGIGDVDELLQNGAAGAVGVLVSSLSESSYSDAVANLKILLRDPNIRQRCRAVAKEQLDLEDVGWTRYRQMYQDLMVVVTQ